MIQTIRKWLEFVLIAMVAASSLAASSLAGAAPPQRIVAVGDLHGDFDAWRQIALKANIIDARNRWAGGASTLVQLGDIADRGPDSLKIITHLMKLQAQAAAAGGRVIVLVGNHEAMNMTGDLRYVSAGEYTAFANAQSSGLRERYFAATQAAIAAAYRAKSPAMTDAAVHTAWFAQTPLGKLEHQAAWSPSGRLGRWTIANPAVAKVGATVFVHGGLSAAYADKPYREINRSVAAALKAGDASDQSILYDPFGPLWYRGLVSRKDDADSGVTFPAGYPSIDEELTAGLRSTGARRMVIAHTPRLAGIEISHNGQLVRIDTGISRYYGGKLSYLEIRGDQVMAYNFDRSPPVAPAH
ncbi:MAG: metallophosphoesterase [Sphingomicrobium sp.]